MNALHWRRAAWIALLLLVLPAAAALRSLQQKRAINAAIQTLPVVQAVLAEHAHGRFAQAVALAAAAEHEAALARYRALFDDPQLGASARYNSANLLLRQAMQLRDSAQPGQAIAYFELAKEGYRALLRLEPGHWDARYNLERALRLQPDADPAEGPPLAPPKGAERAATTMRGTAQGLP
jgi:mxaK protein